MKTLMKMVMGSERTKMTHGKGCNYMNNERIERRCLVGESNWSGPEEPERMNALLYGEERETWLGM